jgi:hypothetical protein
MKFEVFKAVKIHVQFFRIVKPCSFVVGHLHPQGEVKMEKAWTFETLVSYHNTTCVITQKNLTLISIQAPNT